MARRGFRRLLAPMEELEADRLRGRFSDEGAWPIAEAPERVPVRVAGEVTQLRMAPRAGSPTLEVVLTDGTADLVAVFTGRRYLGGVAHGRGVAMDGVIHHEQGRRVMLNPAYTLIGD